jgi:hypothetical protein
LGGFFFIDLFLGAPAGASQKSSVATLAILLTIKKSSTSWIADQWNVREFHHRRTFNQPKQSSFLAF